MTETGINDCRLFHKFDRILEPSEIVVDSGMVKHKADRGVIFLSWDLGGEVAENQKRHIKLFLILRRLLVEFV